jgi:hypothetical protein
MRPAPILPARATVYCLDVTRADSHTLETGLMRVAEDTGGCCMRTNWIPAQVVSRLGNALCRASSSRGGRMSGRTHHHD